MVASSVALRSAALLWLARVAGAQSIQSFASFVQSYGRRYAADSAEYSQRRSLYQQRVAEAESQNRRSDRLWTAGVNEFWDWTAHELSALRGWSGGRRPSGSSGGSRLQSIHKADFLQKVNKSDLPLEKSWSHLAATQNVRSQGACGSCWAVAGVVTMEAAAEIAGKKRTFSAQELVSCAPNPLQCGGQGGCQGATVELAVDYVMKNGAYEEYQAPYLGTDMPCQGTKPSLGWESGATPPKIGEDKNGPGAKFGLFGWETLPENKMEPLMRGLLKGPVAVSADASGWHAYEHGIFDGCVKDAIINHAVVAIGYGHDTATGAKFWHIQNSWGKHWGEMGTIRVLRTDADDTFCGINKKPEQGTGCKGGPKQVTVCGMCGVLYDSVLVHYA